MTEQNKSQPVVEVAVVYKTCAEGVMERTKDTTARSTGSWCIGRQGHSRSTPVKRAPWASLTLDKNAPAELDAEEDLVLWKRRRRPSWRK